VLRAGSSDTAGARQALSDLCDTYWFPLYAYVRSRGHSPEDAEDLTQGFFERLLRLNSIADARQERGKFRAFLLASMKHYLADEWDRASAQKRAVQRTIPLDTALAERAYQTELAEGLSPERIYEKRWAMALLDRVLQRLRQEYETAGKGGLFRELRFALMGEKAGVPYAETAERLSMSPEAVRVTVHRLRARYRELLRQEIAHTVADESEVAAELDYLRKILSA